MLTDDQKEILENWDSSGEERKKERIKSHLAETLVDLTRLRHIDPHVSREVVREAVDKFPVEEFRRENTSGDSKSEFSVQIMSILFNGLQAREFKTGVDFGVHSTVQWWEDETTASVFLKNIRIAREGKYILDQSDIDGQIDYPMEPPENEIERYERILAVRQRHELIDDFTDIQGGRLHFDPKNIFPCKEFNSYTPLDERDDENSERVDLENEICYAYKESQEVAERIAIDLNNPKVDLLEMFGLEPTKFEMREYLELHRRYLEGKGMMPEEDKIPKYEEWGIDIPDPTRLNFLNHVAKGRRIPKLYTKPK
jgi:hypothetical protein